LHYTGAAHTREHPSLTLEALDPAAVLRPPRLDHLDRHHTFEPPVEAPIHATERALAEDVVKFVAVVQRVTCKSRGVGHGLGVSRSRAHEGPPAGPREKCTRIERGGRVGPPPGPSSRTSWSASKEGKPMSQSRSVRPETFRSIMRLALAGALVFSVLAVGASAASAAVRV